MPPDIAKGFIDALRAEYTRGQSEAVQHFFEAKSLAVSDAQVLEQVEERVRNATNKTVAINAIEAEWAQHIAAAAPQAPAAPLAGQVPVDEFLGAIRAALSLPPATSPLDVAIQGAQAQDLEVVRKAVGVAPQVGAASSAQVQEARVRLRAEKKLPEDWDIDTYAKGRFLAGSSGGRQASTVIAFQIQPPHIVEEIQGLFDATYRKVYTRDRRGMPIPDRFAIREVHRVMNEQVWSEYESHRHSVRRKLQGLVPDVPDGTHTGNYLGSHGRGCLPTLDKGVNEQWLFHGTTREAAVGIAENDFRLDFSGSNAGTLYGKGIYLAENASKSDEYGEGPKGAAGEEAEMGFEGPRPPPGPPPPLVRESYILLCRATLGKVNYTDEQRPNPDRLQKSCLTGGFHSVLGDRLKKNGTFREMVVYNDDNVYPEYVVRYERIFFHDRFAEIYKAMMQRKQRGTFRGPLPEETEVLKSMWNVYGMPNKGKINKWQLLDLLNAIKQPPANEGADLDDTFSQWDTKKDGWIDCEEFLTEMIQRVKDGMAYYT